MPGLSDALALKQHLDALAVMVAACCAAPCPRTVPCALKARGAALDRERAAWYRSMGGMGRRERPGRSAGLLLGGALDPPLALSIQGKPPGIAVRHRPRSGYPAGTGTRMGPPRLLVSRWQCLPSSDRAVRVKSTGRGV